MYISLLHEMLKAPLLLQDGAALWCMGFQKAQGAGSMLTILGGWVLIWPLWSTASLLKDI